MKKIGKFNIIEKNVCTAHCHCGWNLHIGGENVADLYYIEKFLKEFDKLTGYYSGGAKQSGKHD